MLYAWLIVQIIKVEGLVKVIIMLRLLLSILMKAASLAIFPKIHINGWVIVVYETDLLGYLTLRLS